MSHVLNVSCVVRSSTCVELCVGLCLQVTKALIDMENMFELLATEPRVQDEPHAATLQVSNGTVEFKQVGGVWGGGLACISRLGCR
jgi:ABC-type transport system involved in Fe-S cluster assembly fused permease/ATPase subunit